MAGNSPTRRSGRFRVESEVDVLRSSVGVILVVSALGVGLGLFSNSFAILFEGTFSLIDASIAQAKSSGRHRPAAKRGH